MNYLTELLLYSLLLFVFSKICYGELAKLHPHPKNLTSLINGVHRWGVGLKLEGIIAALAREFDLAYAVISHNGDAIVTLDSTWVLLS